MKNKKILMFIKIIICLIILGSLGYFIYSHFSFQKNQNNISEYTPQEEITDEQIRQTIIRLYYLNKETNDIAYEDKIVDSKKLINNPYEYIIYLLLSEPKSQELTSIIPKNVKLNNVNLNDGILYIDFSKEFIDGQNLGKEQENLIIKSIVYTLTELTEINKIKINIEGNENSEYPDGEVNFSNYFFRDFAN